ncbi:MAG TPA: hypothetical protein VJK02_03260 [Anaerolineales bacterium]|nr:hypothetical protein [Anaerolineales bacterium]
MIARHKPMCYPSYQYRAAAWDCDMEPTPSLPLIVVYIIERHPLDLPETGPLFSWLHSDNDMRRQLEGLIGPYDPNNLRVLLDREPAGPAWKQLLNGVIQEEVRTVVTHLAPLTSAQRQQLIGVCAEMGARLITPGDAGRNRPKGTPPTSP